MSNITVDTSGPVWNITAVSSGGFTLPHTLCPFDLIPKRIHWDAPLAVAGNQVVLQSQPAGAPTTPVVYSDVASGADYSKFDRPSGREKWPGPIVITEFDTGTLEIAI